MARKLKAKPLSEEQLDALAAIDNPLTAAEAARRWAERHNPTLAALLEAEPEQVVEPDA